MNIGIDTAKVITNFDAKTMVGHTQRDWTTERYGKEVSFSP